MGKRANFRLLPLSALFSDSSESKRHRLSRLRHLSIETRQNKEIRYVSVMQNVSIFWVEAPTQMTNR